MTRLALLTLLGLAASGLSAVSPLGQQDTFQNVLSDKWSWEDCGNPTDPVHIKSIEISPDPPVPGGDLTVAVIGEATRKVEDGAYADVVVKVGVIKLLQKEFDLCEEARNAEVNITCPIEKGLYNVKHTVTLPKEIPPAPFRVSVDGYTVEDDPLLCLQLQIDFRKPRRAL
ncbi:ML domain-containing protein [Irpex rosettiformis]|uniref:ML domain-containing protein n=1 Tax=Irpex rosettiformis TaxID=378272 RepID=A0ACB8UKC1_9APHY|nr:ML domain-containing protein [Irpex rosettiformis]